MIKLRVKYKKPNAHIVQYVLTENISHNGAAN